MEKQTIVNLKLYLRGKVSQEKIEDILEALCDEVIYPRDSTYEIISVEEGDFPLDLGYTMDEYISKIEEALRAIERKRFDGPATLVSFLEQETKLKFHINLADEQNAKDIRIIGTVKDGEKDICDIDIFFILDREDNLYITETNYEFL